MLTSVAYFLASTLILQPVQAEVADRLRHAKVAPQVVAQAQSCVSSALPTLVQRVGKDYWWAVTTAAGSGSVSRLLNGSWPMWRRLAAKPLRRSAQAERPRATECGQ